MDSTTERVGIRELLEAGVHFGHQAKRWNPKMKRYIFAQRTGVHIIDLDQTITLLERALKFIRGVAEANKDVLFVGTKKQAQIPLAEQAIRSGQPYVAERYIGGMLTNFQTILPRIQYFTDLAERVEATPEEAKTGKDWFALNREYQKLRRNFAGLTEMEKLPGAIFVVDPKREELMVKEANRLKIPVVALTDTNCDPEVVDYVVPGNDDAIRSIGLISRLVADAIVAGRGEEFPTDDRPLPPVIEEAQVNEEVEAAKASANGNGAAAAPTAAPTAAPAAAPAEPEAETPVTPAEPAATSETQDGPPDEAQSAAETTTDPADEVVVEEPAAEPAEVVGADDPGAEEPTADVPGAEGNSGGPVVEEIAEEPADGQEDEQSERG